jgi:hypothetical protein
MIYICVISNRISRNLSKFAAKKFGPLRLANEAGRFFTLRFREVPARAKSLSALSFFAQLLN